MSIEKKPVHGVTAPGTEKNRTTFRQKMSNYNYSSRYIKQLQEKRERLDYASFESLSRIIPGYGRYPGVMN